ncbi:MAG: ribonuclease III [Deltaproteobacteria bacterium]|nr:ribonuclease III [Deltaproteobacteria bacterium]
MKFSIPAGNGADDNSDEKKRSEKQSAAEPLGRDHYHKVEEALGHKFKDVSWLERALTHRSVFTKGSKNDYERLEFLGDAVLDLAVAHLLLEKHPEAREGELSKMRAALVNTSSLADIARALEIGPYIRLSRGELASGGSDRPSILADVFEAVMGAVYREAGFEKALACIEKLFGDEIVNVTPRDPKTELQEALHALGSEAPVYMLECVEGPEHAPTFISVVEVDGQIVGRGRGSTKKASQQAAAAEALARLRPDDDIDKMFLTEVQSEE